MSQVPGSPITSEEEYRNIFEAVSEALIIYEVKTGRVVEVNPAACRMYGYSREEFIGLDPAVFMAPESYQLFLEQLQIADPKSVLESLVINLRQNGSLFHAEVRRTAIQYQGRFCLLSAIRDVSQRIQIEKMLSDEIEARRREQATLLAISHTLASTLELKPGLILDQLREIIEFTHGGLFALENSALITLAMRGTPQLEKSAPFRIPLQNAETLTALFNEHQPIRIANVWSEEPQAQFLRSLLEDGAAVLLTGMQSWMWVPLAVKGRIIGGMGIAETTQAYFTAHHADLALSVADQAAITMINAELYGHAQTLAVLEERQRLAHSLHDAVNQSLFSAGLIAEVLPRLWERDQAEARRSLEDLRRLTRGALAEMRALLAELRPSTLTDSNLGDLLRLLGNAFTGRTNLPVEVTTSGEGSLPAERQVALYRICQESLNNIAKHARASRVEIDLRQAEQPGRTSQMQIRDNGRGFDPAGLTPSGHYGLGMMRERAEAVGAVLTIVSQPGQGTEITIQWKE
jgi:two-component system nitrate/nitrite sensor histidine kinase NarX